MSKHNYSQYSKNYQKNETPETFEPKMTITEVEPATFGNVAVVEETAPEVKMEITETVDVVVESTEAVVEETETAPEIPTVGTVVDCSKLNVRATPSLTAKVLTVINRGDKVEIDESISTNDWYCVITSAGIVGYAMREYVKA